MIHEPIKMVVVSGLSALILGGFLFFYIKILGKKISYPVLLLLISLLPLISIIRMGTYESGDLSIHVSFAIPFFESLKEGNLFPVWDKYMLDGYGYPYFLFSYPLPYYLASFAHALGVPFISSLKLVAAFSFTLSGFGMYLFAKEITKKELAGFIAAVFYLFAPYHLVDLHFRFAIGEILAFAALPFCFYFLYKLKGFKNYIYFIFLSLSFGALILSHQAIALISGIFLGFFSIYLYFEDKDFKNFLLRISAVISGILLTAFYWIPVFMESKYTHLLQRTIDFTQWQYYIFSPHRFGLLYQGDRGELYFPVGYVHLPILIFATCILIIPFGRKFLKKDYKLTLTLVTAFFITFFMMLPASTFLWKNLPLINGFQFSYRFSLFCAFFSSLIAGIILSKIKNIKFVYALIAIAALITILNWGNRKNIPQINDQVLTQELYKSTIPVGPGTTIWTNVDELPERKADMTVDSGSVSVQEIKRNSIDHEYLVEVKSDKAGFIENTLYFPGWIVNVNGVEKQIETNKLREGLITFSLPKGLYLVSVDFKSNVYQKLGVLISLVTMVIIVIPLLRKLRKL